MRKTPHATPRRAFLVVIPAVLLFALPAPRAEAAPGDKLLGKWKAIVMEIGGKRHPVKPRIVFHFKRGGKFVITISDGKRNRVQNGTWSATATVITIKIKGKTETAKYKVAGNKLTMDKSIGGRKAKFHMNKIP